jgi:hypothetical protein
MLRRSVARGSDGPACRTDGVQQAAVQGMGVRRSRMPPHSARRDPPFSFPTSRFGVRAAAVSSPAARAVQARGRHAPTVPLSREDR